MESGEDLAHPERANVEANLPDVLPAVELKGSRADKLRTLDATIIHLHQLRSGLAGEPLPGERPGDLRGPYINAPVWPWFTAGWILGALFVVLLLMARAYA